MNERFSPKRVGTAFAAAKPEKNTNAATEATLARYFMLPACSILCARHRDRYRIRLHPRDLQFFAWIPNFIACGNICKTSRQNSACALGAAITFPLLTLASAALVAAQTFDCHIQVIDARATRNVEVAQSLFVACDSLTVAKPTGANVVEPKCTRMQFHEAHESTQIATLTVLQLRVTRLPSEGRGVGFAPRRVHSSIYPESRAGNADVSLAFGDRRPS
jgi:hypothetical protein